MDLPPHLDGVSDSVCHPAHYPPRNIATEHPRHADRLWAELVPHRPNRRELP